MTKIKFAFELLFLVCIFLFTAPANEAKALSGPECSRAIVKIYPYYENDSYLLTTDSYGSGVILDENGTIITNSHVVTVLDEDDKELPTAFTVCVINSDSTTPDCSFTADLIAKDKTKDLALLKIRDIGITGQTKFNFLERKNLTKYYEGDVVQAMGYPASGGSGVTVTYGTINGKTDKYDMTWLKTGAMVYFGSSGGALADLDGNLIGITTQMYSDVYASQGYAIAISSINDWINSNLNNAIQTSPLQKRMENFLVKTNGIKKLDTYSQTPPYLQITKESGWEFFQVEENVVGAYNPNNENGGAITIGWYKSDTLAEPMLDITVKGELLRNNYHSAGTASLSGKKGRKVIYTSDNKEFNQLIFGSKNYMIFIEYYYGADKVDKKAVDKMLTTIKMNDKGNDFKEKRSYQNKSPYFKINLPSGWSLMEQNSKSLVITGQRLKEPEVGYAVHVKNLTDDMKSMTKQQYFDYIKNDDLVRNLYEERYGFIGNRYFEATNFKINDELTSEIFYKYKFKDEKDNDKIKAFSAGFRIIDKDKVIVVIFTYLGSDQKKFDASVENFRKTVLSGLTLGRPIKKAAPAKVTKPAAKKQPAKKAPAVKVKTKK